jgi:DNA-binding CsgD family transcriptional regulator
MSVAGPQFDVAAARAALRDLRRLHREVVEQEEARRLDALEQVRGAVRRISDLGSPEGVLDRAAEELGTHSRFDRVLISEVRDGLLLPHALWQADDDNSSNDAFQRLARSPIRLDYPLIEAEVAQRQEAAIVVVEASGGRSPEHLTDVLGWASYVVVALTLGGRTVGLLHSDATQSGRSVDELDQHVALLYAEGLTRAFERAALHQTLRRHREELRGALQWLSTGLGDPAVDDAAAAGLAGSAESDLADLTKREVEVLQLLVRGRSNAAIATDLLISEGTVKYHVKNILRKLHATSRSDAVARYLRSAE